MDWLEKVLNLPTPMGLLRPLQRHLSISDQGTSDRLRGLAFDIRQQKNQASAQLTISIVTYILENKAQLPLDIPKAITQRLYGEMASKGYAVGQYANFHQKVRELGLLRHANPYLNAYMSAQSPEEKDAILLDMLEHVRPAPAQATGTEGR